MDSDEEESKYDQDGEDQTTTRKRVFSYAIWGLLANDVMEIHIFCVCKYFMIDVGVIVFLSSGLSQ